MKTRRLLVGSMMGCALLASAGASAPAGFQGQGGDVPKGARAYGQNIPSSPGELLAFVWDEAADPVLGATLVPVPDRLRAQLRLREGEGLIVSVLEPNGAAARAGLRPNDILISVGDDPLAKPEDLSDSLKKAGDGKELTLKLLRAGKPTTLKVRAVTTVTLGPAEDTAERTEYVLGVAVSVPDEALRAHLEIPEDRGLIVDQVVKGSAAEKGGIQQNDVLLSMAGTPLDGTEALVGQVRESKDNPTEVRLIREGKELTVVVTPEKRTVRGRASAAGREPFRMWMVDPSVPGALMGPRRGPGAPPLAVPRMLPRPFSGQGAAPRVDDLEAELKSLRKAVEELKESMRSSKSDR